MLQETNPKSQTSEFYVSFLGSGAVEIKEVLIGESMGVASEEPGETLAVLKKVKNSPPEGMYAGTLEELLTYMSTGPSSEEPILRKFLEKIRRSFRDLFS